MHDRRLSITPRMLFSKRHRWAGRQAGGWLLEAVWRRRSCRRSFQCRFCSLFFRLALLQIMREAQFERKYAMSGCEAWLSMLGRA